MRLYFYFPHPTFLTVFVILFVFSFAKTQNRINPFEISPRLKDIVASDTSQSDISQDIASSFTDTRGTLKDTLPSSTDLSKSDGQKKNPFEVDHLPIRKEAASKKKDDFNTISESTKNSTRFLFFFLLLGCVLLAIVLNSNSKSLTLISKSLINENMLKLFQREENIKPSSSLYLLYMIFCINISVFIYLISIKYDGPSGIITYLIILAIVTLVYLFRHAGLSALGKIFPVSKSADLYSFTIMIFNHFIGLFLIPINFLLAFGPDDFLPFILLFAVIIIGIIYFLRIVRGFFIVSEYFSDRLFQIIIYLCAFEIAPVFILLKSVINAVN